MKKYLNVLTALLMALFVFGMPVHADVKDTLFVEDEAAMLSAEDEKKLETILDSIEKQSTIEMAVVTVDNLDGRTIEEAAVNKLRDMGLGKADKNNGLLLMISLEDRAFRLEVGYGLEGVLPDITADRIIEILPGYFQNSDYYGGLHQALINTVYYLNQSGEYSISLDEPINLEEGESDASSDGPPINAIIIIFVLLYVLRFRGRGGRGGRGPMIFFGGGSHGGNSFGGGGGFGGGSSGGGGASGKW